MPAIFAAATMICLMATMGSVTFTMLRNASKELSVLDTLPD